MEQIKVKHKTEIERIRQENETNIIAINALSQKTVERLEQEKTNIVSGFENKIQALHELRQLEQDNLMQQHEVVVSLLETENTTTILQLEAELEAVNVSHEVELEKITNEHKAALNDMEENKVMNKKEIDRLTRAHTDTVILAAEEQCIRQQHCTEQLQQTKKEHHVAIEQLQKEANDTAKETQKKFAKELVASVTEAVSASVALSTLKHQKTVGALKSKHESIVKALHREIKQLMDTSKEDKKTAIKTQQKTLLEAMGKAVDEVNAATALLQEQHEIKLIKMQKQHNQEIENKEHEHKTMVDALVKEMHVKAQEECNQLSLQHQEADAESKKNAQENVFELMRNLSTEYEVQKEIEHAVAKTQAEHQRIQLEHKSNMEGMRIQQCVLHKVINQLQKEKVTTKESVAAAMVAAVETAKVSLNTLLKENKERVNKINRQHDLVVEKLRTQNRATVKVLEDKITTSILQLEGQIKTLLVKHQQEKMELRDLLTHDNNRQLKKVQALHEKERKQMLELHQEEIEERERVTTEQFTIEQNNLNKMHCMFEEKMELKTAEQFKQNEKTKDEYATHLYQMKIRHALIMEKTKKLLESEKKKVNEKTTLVVALRTKNYEVKRQKTAQHMADAADLLVLKEEITEERKKHAKELEDLKNASVVEMKNALDTLMIEHEEAMRTKEEQYQYEYLRPLINQEKEEKIKAPRKKTSLLRLHHEKQRQMKTKCDKSSSTTDVLPSPPPSLLPPPMFSSVLPPTPVSPELLEPLEASPQQSQSTPQQSPSPSLFITPIAEGHDPEPFTFEQWFSKDKIL